MDGKYRESCFACRRDMTRKHYFLGRFNNVRRMRDKVELGKELKMWFEGDCLKMIQLWTKPSQKRSKTK